MKLFVDLGRWTTTKAALAVAGALAIGGAVGSAVAISPTIDPPIKWQGGVEFRTKTLGSALVKVYTVPAGRSFLLTDFTASNSSNALQLFSIYSGAGGVCGGASLTTRVHDVIAPSQNNAVLAFQTGIGFGAGQAVCIGASNALEFNARGFLFTPS